MKAPLPKNEAERLKTLQNYRILDSGSEKAFDELTELAGLICDAPISLITLIDKDRQWFKSAVGIGGTETSRDIAFCSHAILQNDIFIIEDATKDKRFWDNPFVTSDPSIRFYAGAPLIVGNGSALGTLCVVDKKPRHLTDSQLKALSVLRKAVITQLELRRTLQDMDAIGNILPICSWCRKVRNPDQSWTPLHEYVAGSVSVTHGMCPNCANKMQAS